MKLIFRWPDLNSRNHNQYSPRPPQLLHCGHLYLCAKTGSQSGTTSSALSPSLEIGPQTLGGSGGLLSTSVRQTAIYSSLPGWWRLLVTSSPNIIKLWCSYFLVSSSSNISIIWSCCLPAARSFNTKGLLPSRVVRLSSGSASSQHSTRHSLPTFKVSKLRRPVHVWCILCFSNAWRFGFRRRPTAMVIPLTVGPLIVLKIPNYDIYSLLGDLSTT